MKSIIEKNRLADICHELIDMILKMRIKNDFGNILDFQNNINSSLIQIEHDTENNDISSQEFEHQFDQLSIRLKELCLGKLAIPRSLDIQQKLYNFPQKFYALRENIINFVSKVFKPNFYDENPIFRGFYFTSSIPTQKTGKKASEEIEMQFDPERHVTNLSELKQPAKKYFIKELFSKIIIPDKNISIPTKRMLLRLNIKNISPALLLIITIFIIIINVLNNVNRNRDDISKLKTLMNKIEKVTWNEKFEYSQLKLLKSLIDHNQHLQDKPILGGTIYQGQRLSGQVDQIFIKNLFKERYNSGYQKGFNEKNLNNASNIVQEEIIYYIEAISRSKTDKWSSVIKNDKSLIENARNAIGKPNISDVYARIKREGLVKFKQLSIAEILSENEFDIYDKNTSISEFFTKTGWNKYVQDEIEKSCKNPGENDWVLNIKASELPDDLKDAATIKQGLKDKYFLDYSKAWWEFLRNISYQNFENPETAAERLIGLGDFIDSPLRILLKIVSNQTKF
ncbi:MAG: ImcF-related family protein, partial [Calditrichaceae bacterium]